MLNGLGLNAPCATNQNGYTGYVTNNIVPGQGSPSQVFITRPRTFYPTAEVDF